MRSLIWPLIGVIFIALPAQAQSFLSAKCGDAEGVVASLARLYDERPVQTTVTSANERVQVFADPDELTWSLVTFSPDGLFACLVIHGIGPWLPLTPQIPGQDASR